MIINWYGQSCFRLQSGKLTIFVDPFAKSIGLTPPRGEADLVMITHDHPDHNNVSALSGSKSGELGSPKGDFFLIDGPGEYEVKGVRILGMQCFHDMKNGAERGVNTLYRFEIEDMVFVHCGDLGQKELTSEQLEALGDVDVLMIPVGGVYTIDGKQAAAIANQIEPKLVIPMHYKIPGLVPKLEDASQFLKELGYEGNAVDKLTLKQKDLSEEHMQIIVMRA